MRHSHTAEEPLPKSMDETSAASSSAAATFHLSGRSLVRPSLCPERILLFDHFLVHILSFSFYRSDHHRLALGSNSNYIATTCRNRVSADTQRA